jgi:hypothetical protein
MAAFTLYTSADGRAYLLHQHGGDLFYGSQGKETRLPRDPDTRFVAVAFDRSLGLVAALDTTGALHLYEQQIRIGAVDIGLASDEDWMPSIAIAYGGTPILCSDGRSIVLADATGKVQKRLTLPYQAGMLICSPDGQHVAVADAETGVIRVYSGADLLPTHQRFASDLLVEARRVQLMAGSAGSSTALSALAINNKGILAFAMSGVVCVTNIARMAVLPRV